MITFDDGYRDNLTFAHPVLAERGLPWTLFLTTGHIGGAQPFYWDLAAFCFEHARVSRAEFPGVGRRSWSDDTSRGAVLDEWVRAMKRLPEEERQRTAPHVAEALEVDVPPGRLARLILDWDEVRWLAAAGVHLGAHSQTHPILSRTPATQAEEEIEGSMARIEAETGRGVSTFAYPNGQPGDFGQREMTCLRRVGIRAAFTLSPGPASYESVRERALSIRRIMVAHDLGSAAFGAKVIGERRLAGALKDFLAG